MTSRENATAVRRRLAADVQRAVDDVRETRIELGLSQGEVARAAGISRSHLSRIEGGQVASPRVEDLATVAAALGMRLRVALYPEDEPLRDRVQVPGLTELRKRIHSSMAWRSEVVLPGRGDRRAWDAVVIDEERTWTAVEWISRVGAVDAMLRRTNQKHRDDPRIGSVVLAVNDTVRNRHALRDAIAIVRADYPLGSREVLAALGHGTAPPLNGIVLVRIPGDRPQRVHSRGNLVDGYAPEAAQLVENPVGRPFTEP